MATSATSPEPASKNGDGNRLSRHAIPARWAPTHTHAKLDHPGHDQPAPRPRHRRQRRGRRRCRTAPIRGGPTRRLQAGRASWRRCTRRETRQAPGPPESGADDGWRNAAGGGRGGDHDPSAQEREHRDTGGVRDCSASPRTSSSILRRTPRRGVGEAADHEEERHDLNTHVSQRVHGAICSICPAWIPPSPEIHGAATSQWPKTTSRMEMARRKSMERLRSDGVSAMRSAARGVM